MPQYRDAEESDVFILSGAEDLVPAFKKDATGKWLIEDGKHVIFDEPRTVDSVTYHVRHYRPRIEGLFACIERWISEMDPSNVFWRLISKDNVTTWYGKTSQSRIVDPADPTRIFSWLICESYDGKGNSVRYDYQAENDENVDQTQANERNRVHTANRYLKRVRYGNHVPYFPQFLQNKPWPALPGDGNWFFEVVFDYGEHHPDAPGPNDEKELDQNGTKKNTWPCRSDSFSAYRSGFEVRTCRLCQRVLMFHHFANEAEVGNDCLVRSTDFTYSFEQNPTDARNQIASFIASVTQSGYKRTNADSYLKKSLPPLEFEYSKATIQDDIRDLDTGSLENLPIGLDGATYQWVDLDGEGVTGILTEQANVWFYKPNLGEGSFGPLEVVAARPSLAALSSGRQQLLDLAGDGQLDLVTFAGSTPGFYERTQDKDWELFKEFVSLPNVLWDEPNLRFIDLNGDGHADVLVTEHEVFTWHLSLAEAGFGPARYVRKPLDEETGPRLVFADGTQSIYLADMSGDGLTDLVRISNGEVCYWPNLGYGHFGARITMDNAPWFDFPDLFDQRRIRLADIDGSGTNDMIYLGHDGVRLYFNLSGNRWSEPCHLSQFPRVDTLSSVMTADLLGNGTACLVWSSPSPGNTQQPVHYIDLMGGQKPHLLIKVRNNLGAETEIQYAPSTKFYLADKRDGKPWITRLPFPVHCVESITVRDKWRKTSFVTTYSYHHGYFDGMEREFHGFGRVEQVDVESFGEFAQGNTASPYITDQRELYQPPVKSITWYYTGASLDQRKILSSFRGEYFPNSFEALDPNWTNSFRENDLPEPDIDADELSTEEWREALRACKGMTLRQEIYELDVDAMERGEHRLIKLFSVVILKG